MSGETKKRMKSVVCAGMVILAVAGCARANLVDSNSIFVDGIEYYIQTDKFVYDLGENVEMLYRVTNLRDEEVTVHFLDQVQYYFTVKDNGNLIWDAPKVGLPALSSFVLPPSGYIEYTETWDMLDNQGVLITPGNYEVTGSLHPVLLFQEDEDKYVPVSVSIGVIPEPATMVLLGVGMIGIILNKKERGKR